MVKATAIKIMEATLMPTAKTENPLPVFFR
jgi:hypothetical protein